MKARDLYQFVCVGLRAGRRRLLTLTINGAKYVMASLARCDVEIRSAALADAGSRGAWSGSVYTVLCICVCVFLWELVALA